MSQKRIIAVVGATGAQGGGLARAILADQGGPFALRAITRNPGSDKAKALAQAGAEVVAADTDDPSSLPAAFRGAECAYCVTNYWEHFDANREIAQAKALASSIKAAGVKHAIWSTLEDTRKWIPLEDQRMPTLHGQYKVPHFDTKGQSDQYFVESGVPTTLMLTSFYWDNLISLGMGPKKGADGKYTFVLPMGDRKLPGIAVEDIGRCAYGIFKRGAELAGKRVGIAGGHLTGAEMAAQMSAAFKVEISYVSPSFEAYRGFGFPGADDLGNMYQFKHDFNDYYCGARSLEFSRSINPELQTFERWLAVHRGQFALD